MRSSRLLAVNRRSRLSELFQVPLGMRYERSQDVSVQGNRPAIPRLGLGLSYGHDGLLEVNLRPLEVPKLSVPHPCVQGKHQGRIDGRRAPGDRKSTRLNSSHLGISYAV